MSPPSSDDMRTGRHYIRVMKELEPLQCLIDKVKSLGLAIERAGHIERTSTASTVARCQPIAARGGSQVVVGGLHHSVLDLVRTCNRMTLAQNRILRGRYQTMHRLSATLAKVPGARDAGEDVAVGGNVLTMFQEDPARTGVDLLFCVGQIRQISAAMRSGRKLQNWLSVGDDDASALMFYSPWAAVDADSGRLLFSEEPAEYYGLKQMEHDLQDCDDDNADLPSEIVVKSKFSVEPLLLKHVEVEW
jgi:hypothetical protein